MKVFFLESSYNRVVKHVTSGQPFALISASRSRRADGTPLKDFHNKRRTKDMKFHIRGMGYGFTRVHGRYGEKQPDGKLVHSGERSFLVPGMSKKHAIQLGKRYGQDSVLHHSGGKRTFNLYRTKPEPKETGGKHRVGSVALRMKKFVPGEAQFDTAVTKAGWSKPRAKPPKKPGRINKKAPSAFHLDP